MEIESSQTPSIPSESVPGADQPADISIEDAGDLGDVAAMDLEEPSTASTQVRDTAIFLNGVDDLGAKDVEKFVTSFYPKPFFMEWIDDTSVNIVYEDPEDAFQFLVAITSETEFSKSERIEPTQLRLTKPDPVRNIVLKARFATVADKKVQKSRERSRYYLLNGEPTRKDDIVRFGSERSGAYRYGVKDQDLLGGGKRRGNRHGSELFPSKVKNKAIRANDEQVLRERAKEPDLFAHKFGVSKSRHPRKRRDRQKKAAPVTTIYSNMDY